MIIHVERSGGFAGIILRKEIDTARLDPQEGRRLAELVESVDFFNTPPNPAAGSTGADRFQWQLTVERGGEKHSVVIHEGSLPQDWQPLIQMLQSLLRRRS